MDRPVEMQRPSSQQLPDVWVSTAQPRVSYNGYHPPAPSQRFGNRVLEDGEFSVTADKP